MKSSLFSIGDPNGLLESHSLFSRIGTNHEFDGVPSEVVGEFYQHAAPLPLPRLACTECGGVQGVGHGCGLCGGVFCSDCVTVDGFCFSCADSLATSQQIDAMLLEAAELGYARGYSAAMQEMGVRRD
jgi:hypothetical protein